MKGSRTRKVLSRLGPRRPTLSQVKGSEGLLQPQAPRVVLQVRGSFLVTTIVHTGSPNGAFMAIMIRHDMVSETHQT